MAEGDPPNTHRYWDGEAWVGNPIPIPPSPATPGTEAPSESPSPTASAERPVYEAPPTPQSPPTYDPTSFEPAAFEPSPFEPATVSSSPPAPEAPFGEPPSTQVDRPFGTTATASTFPSGLRTLVIIVTVVKAIPLLVVLATLAIFAFVGANLAGEIDDAIGWSVGGFVVVFLVIFLSIFLIGALLLFFQLRGVLKGNRTTLLVPACIMAAMDTVLFLGSFGDGADTSGMSLTFLVGAAQIAIVVWAWRSKGVRELPVPPTGQ